jgi:hypothetical protein
VGVELQLVGRPRQRGADDRTDHLAQQVRGHEIPAGPGVGRDQAERHRRVDVSPRWSRDARSYEHRETPAEGDEKPAAPATECLLEYDIRHDTGAEHNQAGRA